MRRPAVHRYLRASCFAVATCFGTLTAHAQTIAPSPVDRHGAPTPGKGHGIEPSDLGPSAAAQALQVKPKVAPGAKKTAPLPVIPAVPQPLTNKGRGPGRNNQYLLRFDEDYSAMRDPAVANGSLPYKFIPLDAQRDSWLTLIGGERLFFDHNDINVVNTPASSTNQFEARTTLGADLHLGRHLRFYLEGISGQYEGPADSPGKTSAAFGIYNAFGEIMNQTGDLTYGLRLGRQELWLGNGMVMSNRDLANIPTTWNGARAYADWDYGHIDIFDMVPTLYAENPLAGKLGTGLHLSGLYGSFGLPSSRLAGWPLSSSIDPFFIRYTADTNAYQSAAMLERGAGTMPHFAQGPDTRNSFGIRYYGGLGPIDFDYTGVFQSGKTLGDKVKAWMFTTQTDYVWRDMQSQPRIGLRFDAGSGGTSGKPGQGEINTYQPLYYLVPYYGDGLTLSQSNNLDFGPRASMNFAHNTRLDLLWSFNYRQNQNDAIYNGSALGYGAFNPYYRTVGVRGKYIGSLPEIILHWRQSRYQLLTFTLAYFMPGAALQKIGGRSTCYGQIESMMFF